MKRTILSLFLFAYLCGAADGPLSKPADPTALDPKDQTALAAAAINYLSARVSLLEALSESRAGTQELKTADAQMQSYLALLTKLREKSKAGAQCNWDFSGTAWRCPVQSATQ